MRNLHLDKLLDICCYLGRIQNSNAKTKHFSCLSGSVFNCWVS